MHMTSFNDLKGLKDMADRMNSQSDVLFRALSKNCVFKKVDTTRPGQEWFRCTHKKYHLAKYISITPCSVDKCPKLG